MGVFRFVGVESQDRFVLEPHTHTHTQEQSRPRVQFVNLKRPVLVLLRAGFTSTQFCLSGVLTFNYPLAVKCTVFSSFFPSSDFDGLLI